MTDLNSEWMTFKVLSKSERPYFNLCYQSVDRVYSCFDLTQLLPERK